MTDTSSSLSPIWFELPSTLGVGGVVFLLAAFSVWFGWQFCSKKANLRAFKICGLSKVFPIAITWYKFGCIFRFRRLFGCDLRVILRCSRFGFVAYRWLWVLLVVEWWRSYVLSNFCSVGQVRLAVGQWASAPVDLLVSYVSVFSREFYIKLVN